MKSKSSTKIAKSSTTTPSIITISDYNEVMNKKKKKRNALWGEYNPKPKGTKDESVLATDKLKELRKQGCIIAYRIREALLNPPSTSTTTNTTSTSTANTTSTTATTITTTTTIITSTPTSSTSASTSSASASTSTCTSTSASTSSSTSTPTSTPTSISTSILNSTSASNSNSESSDKEKELEKETEEYFITIPPNIAVMDSVVISTVQLQEFAFKAQAIIADISKANITDDPNLYPTKLDIPLMSSPARKRCNTFPNLEMVRDDTHFSTGYSRPSLRLSATNARIILCKAVSAILAQHGFVGSEGPALNVLSEVAGDVLTNICKALRVAVDQDLMYGQSGFHDSVERVFTELGLGSIDDISYFYQEDVIGRHETMEKKCVELSNKYSEIRTRIFGLNEIEKEDEEMPMEDEEMEEEEEEEDEEDIPEIHFPALDEEDQLGLQPSLEPGFQMLDSLEHDETLQNLDPDEEINVSDSPSQEFMLNVISELSNTIELNKSKRRKTRK